MESPFLVLAQVTRILQQHQIDYVLVGSLASSMHGMYRSTADIDILADVRADQVRSLVEAMENSFYIDELAVRQAVYRHTSFNAIHLDSVFKVDIFIPKLDDFGAQQLKRRQLSRISPDIEQEIYVATAEDTILAKLRWYRAGREVSTTQWSDVVGVIGAAGQTLDYEYLREWGEKLGVLDLLEEALKQVG